MHGHGALAARRAAVHCSGAGLQSKLQVCAFQAALSNSSYGVQSMKRLAVAATGSGHWQRRRRRHVPTCMCGGSQCLLQQAAQ